MWWMTDVTGWYGLTFRVEADIRLTSWIEPTGSVEGHIDSFESLSQDDQDLLGCSPKYWDLRPTSAGMTFLYQLCQGWLVFHSMLPYQDFDCRKTLRRSWARACDKRILTQPIRRLSLVTQDDLDQMNPQDVICAMVAEMICREEQT